MTKKMILIYISSFVAVVLIIYLLAAASLRIFGIGMVFEIAPSKDLQYDFSYQRDFVTNRAGNKIELITNLSNDKPVVLYLHGNIGRLPALMKEIVKEYNLVSPAYPGYSQSEGEPNTDNIYETVDVTMDYIRAKGFADQDIMIIGHSMGGSPAVYASTRYPNVQKVVLVNTFYSIQNECQRQYSLLCVFAGDVLPSGQIARGSQSKVVQFHNPNDERIPYGEGKKLQEAIASKDKRFLDIQGTHGEFDPLDALSRE